MKEKNNYRGNDPMSPEKITSHEPTAVKRNKDDQEIVDQGNTGTNSNYAEEQYKKK
jgi:hypothetical protein